MSYDSATLDSAIGLIDLKLLCKCFAYAIEKHIIFSQGKVVMRELGMKPGEEPQRFTYQLNEMLKIDLPTRIGGPAYEFKDSPQKKVKDAAQPKEEEKQKQVQLQKQKQKQKQEQKQKQSVGQLDAARCKQLLSESFSALSGQFIPPELLNSYLTLENQEEDIDLTYTQNHLDEFIKSSNSSCIV